MLQHLTSILQTQMSHNKTEMRPQEPPVGHPSTCLTNLLLNVNDENYEHNSYHVESLFTSVPVEDMID